MKKTRHEMLADKYKHPIEKRRKAEIAYTLHPPKGEFTQEEIRRTPAYLSERIAKLSEDVVPLDNIVTLGLQQTAFGKNDRRRPIYAIEAFLTAHNEGLYPPMWVLNDIAERLRKWYAQSGNTSLDRFFGVDLYAGEGSIFKTDMLNARNNFLCLRAHILISKFEFSIKKACKIIANTHQDVGLSASSIESKYIKMKYAKIFNNREYAKLLRHILWTGKKKISFLEQLSKSSTLRNKKRKSIEDLIYDIVVRASMK